MQLPQKKSIAQSTRLSTLPNKCSLVAKHTLFLLTHAVNYNKNGTFILMKAGLFYTFLIIFTLVIVSYGQKNEKQSFGIESCQSIETNNNSDCIIPEINFSLKKTLQKANLFRLVNVKHFENNHKNRINQISAFLNLYQKRTFDLKPFNQRLFRLLLYSSADKIDSYNLS